MDINKLFSKTTPLLLLIMVGVALCFISNEDILRIRNPKSENGFLNKVTCSSIGNGLRKTWDNADRKIRDDKYFCKIAENYLRGKGLLSGRNNFSVSRHGNIVSVFVSKKTTRKYNYYEWNISGSYIFDIDDHGVILNISQGY